MVKKVARRVLYGVYAWLFVFALSTVLVAQAGLEYLVAVPIVAPFFFFFLALRCLRIKKPDWGSEGLKAGAAWVLTAAVLDLVIVPLVWEGDYGIYLTSIFPYIIYAELLIVPWFADKLMTSLRTI